MNAGSAPARMTSAQFKQYLAFVNQFTPKQRAAFNKRQAAQQKRGAGKRQSGRLLHAAGSKRGLAAPGAGDWVTGANSRYPTCAATAVANSLLAATGRRASDADVLALHMAAAGSTSAEATISRVLDVLDGNGIGGIRPAEIALADLAHLTHGQWVILGMTMTTAQQFQMVWDCDMDMPEWGSHAAASDGESVITWGTRIPLTPRFLAGQAEEAWDIEW